MGKVLTSDASGLATWQTPAAGGAGVGFAANKISGTQNFLGGAILYSQVTFNNIDFNSGAYSTSTSYFTTPSAGVYHFDVQISIGACPTANTTVSIYITEATNGNDQSATIPCSAALYNNMHLSTNLSLPAGDQIGVAILNNNASGTISLSPLLTENRFSGYKVY